MKYLLKFRTARFEQRQLPDLPKSAGVMRFTAGVVVGTVAAVVIFGGGESGRNTIALVDVSESMRDLDAPLQKHLSRLQRGRIAPGIVRTAGFGLRSDLAPTNLLGSLENALASNPAISTVYLFSDFTCKSPDSYDASDEAGQRRFWSLIHDHGIRLFVGQLRDPPDEDLVTLARKSGGDWIDANGQPVRRETARVDSVVLRGTVRTAVEGRALPEAIVSAAGIPTKTDAAGSYTLALKNVAPGRLPVTVSSPGFPPTTIPVTVQTCRVPGKEVSLDISVTPPLAEGEMLITLNWTKNESKPYDLDLHLTGPDKLHLFFARKGNLSSPPFAHLDLDNVEQDPIVGEQRIDRPDNAPAETMHIAPGIGGGIYRLDVCDFRGETNDGMAGSAGATVRVFGSHGLLFEDKATKPGREWTVFTWDRGSGKFTRMDTFSDGKERECCLRENCRN